MSNFKIGTKIFGERVLPIGEANYVAMSGPCTLFPHRKRHGSADAVFIRCANGEVYTAGRSNINLLREWGCNDGIRRAWCKAAGVKFQDLSAALKKYREREKSDERSDRLQRLRKSAQQFGYRLVRS